MSEMCILYGTAESQEQAEMLALLLVEERLAACANILGTVTSVYRWEGEICKEEEVSFIVKTTERMVDEVVRKIKKHHSYACPSILSISISGGNDDFISWVRGNVST